MDESQSYLIATEHKECYDGLIKSYDLDKSLFSTYDKVYSLKRSRKDKDKDEDPRQVSIKSSRKSVQTEEPEFKVADSDMPQNQDENLGNDDEEPKGKLHLNVIGLPNLNNLKNPLILIGMLSRLHNKDLLKPGPTFKLLKGTRTNFAELEYDFEECYKALSEKLDWDNPEGGDYPFDLTKPLPLVMNENRQMVPVDYFFNNDLKYLHGGISTMTYTTSITKTQAA
ncbi:hypothetical protein Tco_1493727 [Tanacetum coccineum]